MTLWQNGQYDAILMDVDMPIMNGYEATEKIRKHEKLIGRHIPILAMTAHAMKGAREECLRQGMDGYLTKPIDTEALWRELDGLSQAQVANVVTEQPKPQYAIVDFEKALQTMDNSRELFDEIAGLFLDDAPSHMQDIRDSLAEGDAKAVRHCAHALKGMAGVFAAERTMKAAERVEKSAGQEDCAEAVADLEIALSELQAVINGNGG